VINGEIKFYIENGTKELPHSLNMMVDYIHNLGCGEVFITSIDNDGAAEGYDIESITKMVEAFKVPVIACGGASSVIDFIELSRVDKISGIAAGNMFHFTENVYPRSKSKLKSKKLNFR
jgi:cyclase